MNQTLISTDHIATRPQSIWINRLFNERVIITTALDTIAFRLEKDDKNNIYECSREYWNETFNYIRG